MITDAGACSDVPLRTNALWAIRGDAPARMASAAPGLSRMSLPTSAPVDRSEKSMATVVAPVISTSTIDSAESADQKTDAQRRRSIADDSESDELSRRHVRSADHGRIELGRRRRKPDRRAARHPAHHAHVVPETELLAVFTRLHHDSRSRPRTPDGVRRSTRSVGRPRLRRRHGRVGRRRRRIGAAARRPV